MRHAGARSEAADLGAVRPSFVVPSDRLSDLDDGLRPAALPLRPAPRAARPSPSSSPGGAVDLSIGTPSDPPPDAVVEALAASGTERGYPPSIGTAAYRDAAAGWMARRLGVEVDPDRDLAACVGHEGAGRRPPALLRLRDPSRDTVLYPAVSLPVLRDGGDPRRLPSGARAPSTTDWRLDLVVDRSRRRGAGAVPVGRTRPGNPAGGLDDLGAAAAWGRAHGVPVFSDECYVEFTWDGPPSARSAPGADDPLARDRRRRWRCTRSRSDRTSPASGPASTRATRRWSTTSARSASTRA